MLFHTSILIWCGGGGLYPQYMSILLYDKLIWCNGIQYTCGQLECRGYMHPQYMCILLYVKLSFGVMVFHPSLVT